MQEDTRAELARIDEAIRGIYKIMDEREKAVIKSFAAAETASELATTTQRAVNATQNEFRGALLDQSKSFVTRPEHDQLDARLQTAERQIERLNAGGGARSEMLKVVKGDLFAVIALLVSIAAVAITFFRK